MAKILTKIPKFRRCVLQNFPFIEQDFDALTDYELLCKVVEYLNKVIKSQNEVIDIAEALTAAFNELQSFVVNYFANLDVQEEINNKLDQMAEDGTLQEIITAYIQANVAWTFDTVADMKLATNLVNGSYARTLGYHTLNDGGGALYKITNTGTANEMDIIAVGDLIANLINGNNVKQYGAYGDNEHDDSSYIQRAISANYHCNIHIPAGEYAITTPINITSAINISGDGFYSVLIKKDTSVYNASVNYNNVPFNFNDYPSIFNVVFPTDSNLNYLKINNIRFSENVTGQTKSTYGIVAPHLTFSSIENCRFNGFNECIVLGGWCDLVRKCEFFSSTMGISTQSTFNFNNNKISECYFNGTYIRIRNSHNSSINNCQADSVGIPFLLVDCESISLINCSTEVWNCSIQASNSVVNVEGGDFELHDKDRYQAFINATDGSEISVSGAYIHYEDYADPGVYPSSNNIISNSGASIIRIKDTKISIPFTYKDYLSGNGINEINGYVNSNVMGVPSKFSNKVTSGTKVEIARLPLAYGTRIQAKISGYGTYDYNSVLIDANIAANNRGSSSRPIVVSDNTITANTSSVTCSITAEYADDELIIYYNQSNVWAFPIEVFVEYNKANA